MKEFEERIGDLEKKLASQGESVLRVGKGLETLNGHRDERDKIIIKLFGMVKKSMERRVVLMAQIARMKSSGPVKKTRRPVRKAKAKKPIATTPENS